MRAPDAAASGNSWPVRAMAAHAALVAYEATLSAVEKITGVRPKVKEIDVFRGRSKDLTVGKLRSWRQVPLIHSNETKHGFLGVKLRRPRQRRLGPLRTARSPRYRPPHHRGGEVTNRLGTTTGLPFRPLGPPRLRRQTRRTRGRTRERDRTAGSFEAARRGETRRPLEAGCECASVEPEL